MSWRFTIGEPTFQTRRSMPYLLKSNSEVPHKLLHLTQANEEYVSQNYS